MRSPLKVRLFVDYVDFNVSLTYVKNVVLIKEVG